MKTDLLSFLIFFWMGISLPGQVLAQTQDTLASTEQNLEIPRISVEEYTGDPAFDYTPKTERKNIFLRAIEWVKRQLVYLLQKILTWLLGQKAAGKALQIILKALPYVAVLIFVYLIFKFLLGVDLIRLKSSSQNLENKVYLSDEERIINEEDLQQLIQKAIADKNYRLAVRYYYLYTLKQLRDAGLIQWHAEKTNRDYVRELPDENLKPRFKNLTFIYDYVWYGNYKPAEKDFESIEKDFKTFQI